MPTARSATGDAASQRSPIADVRSGSRPSRRVRRLPGKTGPPCGLFNVRVADRMVDWRSMVVDWCSMDQNTRDILEAVNFIKERVEQLPTKDDVRAIVEEVVDEKLRPLHASLTEINRRLDTIEEHNGNLKGVTKEIDEIREEVRKIQKHLGIEKKIAA